MCHGAGVFPKRPKVLKNEGCDAFFCINLSMDTALVAACR